MRTLSGRISNEPEEREREREKKAIYSGHLRLCQQPRAALALRSDQNAENKSNTFLLVDSLTSTTVTVKVANLIRTK